MQAKEIILKKRNGEVLSADELRFLLQGFIDGSVTDYQMAAWLMAVHFRGLSPDETLEWTRLMWKSGDSFPRPKGASYWIDKHSTGGIGDKPSLILVPLVQAVAIRLWGAGHLKIPMVSGRGLGHTGGTLDKLESVPGFSPRITLEQALELLDANGWVMMGQTERLAPVDRRLYALRDVTATVESVPLIVSSILSKKLAESLDGLVLDVKVGAGGFMESEERARALAEALLTVAKGQGLETVALLTRMEEPLGATVGHALEMEESARFLRGEPVHAGLFEVTLELAAWMLSLASRRVLTVGDARGECLNELKSPRPFALFQKMLEVQGGDWRAFEIQRAQDRQQLRFFTFRAPRAGYVSRISARECGTLLTELGGGRLVADGAIDYAVGMEFSKKVGDTVACGESVVTVSHRREDEVPGLEQRLSRIVEISERPPATRPWIVGSVT